MSELTELAENTPRLIPHNSSTQTLPVPTEETQTPTLASDGSTPVMLPSEQSITHHQTAGHLTTTTTEKDHYLYKVAIEGDSSHMAVVDHQIIHKTTTTTATKTEEQGETRQVEEEENILETMIEELYEKDDLIRIIDADSDIPTTNPTDTDPQTLSASLNAENSSSKNHSEQGNVASDTSSSEVKRAQAAVLTHVPFAVPSTPMSTSTTALSESADRDQTELKAETGRSRSSSFSSANLPDFIRIPSFSFINGTYYLYQKVSTTLNSGMTSASETSNHLLNAVTTTIHTTFSSSTSNNTQDNQSYSASSTMVIDGPREGDEDSEEVLVGEKRLRIRQEEEDEEEEESQGNQSHDHSPAKRMKGESS